MFYGLLVLLEIATLCVWSMSTLHMWIWWLDPQGIPKPFPAEKNHPEMRVVKYAKIWAYAPSIVTILSWRWFKATPTGASLLKWFNDRV